MIRTIDNLNTDSSTNYALNTGVITSSGQSILFHDELSEQAVVVRPLYNPNVDTSFSPDDRYNFRKSAIRFYLEHFQRYVIPTTLHRGTADITFSNGRRIHSCPTLVKTMPWMGDVQMTSDVSAEVILSNHRLKQALIEIYSKSIWHLTHGILPDLGWTNCSYNRGPLGLNIGSPNILIGQLKEQEVIFMDCDGYQVVSAYKETDPKLGKEAFKHLTIKLASLLIPFGQRVRITAKSELTSLTS